MTADQVERIWGAALDLYKTRVHPACSSVCAGRTRSSTVARNRYPAARQLAND